MKTIVYFSGGIDSTGALLWATRVYGKENTIALHAELDAEIPTISEHVEVVVKHLGVEFHKIYVGSILEEFYKREVPYFANPWCKKEFIHTPLNHWVTKHHKPQDTLLVFGGTSTEKIDKLLCGGRWIKPNRNFYDRFRGIKRYPTIQPFFYWKKEDILNFVKSEGCPTWSGYDKGFVRTACWICPLQSQRQLVALYKIYPELFEKLNEYEQLKWETRGKGIKSKGESIIKFGMRGVNRERAGEGLESVVPQDELHWDEKCCYFKKAGDTGEKPCKDEEELTLF